MGQTGVVLRDCGALLEELAEVLSLPGNGGLFVLLDGLRREVTAGDVGEVLGAEAGRELGGDTRGLACASAASSSVLWALSAAASSEVMAPLGPS
jgi:hypothetical protein